VTELRAHHPEWAAYLALLGLALEEARAPVWQEAVPPLDGVMSGQCLLAGTTVRIPERALTRWVRAIVDRAAEESAAVRPLAEALHAGRLDGVTVFEAALAGGPERLGGLGRDVRVEANAFQSLAPLIGMPLWQACGRAWANRIPLAWDAGYCPICGAWPDLAEIRGLENCRRLRCGQCGADWPGQWLRCHFCGGDDYRQLGALVLPDPCDSRRVDVCQACGGYIKTMTTLSPMPPGEVMLHDLATVTLDVTALEHGYRRPLPVRQPSPRVVPAPSRLSRLLGRHP
jgi:FdhE protein